MNKKTSLISLIILVIAAILFGIVLVNKGDGPVMGMVLADRVLNSTEEFEAVSGSQGTGVYIVLSNEMNRFKEKYKAEIPEGKDIYVSVYFVECPKGSRYTGKWVTGGEVVFEETGTLQTDSKGIVSYKLDANKAVGGSYVFELYEGDKRIFEYSFEIG